MRPSAQTTIMLSLSLAFALAGCEKSGGTSEIAPPPESPARSAPPPSPSASPSAPQPTAAPDAAPGSASEVPTAALATADAGGVKAKEPPPGARSPEPVSKRIARDNFTLELSSPGCRVGVECAMTIKLVATGEYHVNKEYPYKFVASPAPNLTFLGTGDGATFTRAAGDFAEQGEKVGTMTVRFKPSVPGDASVTGTYKLSVCSADQCQIEQEKIDLTIPVR